MNELERARARRENDKIDLAIGTYVDQKAPKMPQVEKLKVKSTLKHYAQSPTPFRDFVRDNMAKFGPGRTEMIGAVLCGEIKGKKPWKAKALMSEVEIVKPSIDGDVLLALDAISKYDLKTVMLEVRALEEHGSKSSVSLLGLSGAEELARVGAGLNLKEAS